MSLHWVHEHAPVWDADKQRVSGGAPPGAFVLPFAEGDELPGDWWAVHDGAEDGPVVGYGRLDITFGGDAEILLATDPARRGEGIGSFSLERLEGEAADRGINYIFNTIREHDARPDVHAWLTDHGFDGPMDGDLRKRVGHPTPA
jgi:GNAT superfamily N-acetyltransferase